MAHPLVCPSHHPMPINWTRAVFWTRCLDSGAWKWTKPIPYPLEFAVYSERQTYAVRGNVIMVILSWWTLLWWSEMWWFFITLGEWIVSSVVISLTVEVAINILLKGNQESLFSLHCNFQWGGRQSLKRIAIVGSHHYFGPRDPLQTCLSSKWPHKENGGCHGGYTALIWLCRSVILLLMGPGCAHSCIFPHFEDEEVDKLKWLFKGKKSVASQVKSLTESQDFRLLSGIPQVCYLAHHTWHWNLLSIDFTLNRKRRRLYFIWIQCFQEIHCLLCGIYRKVIKFLDLVCYEEQGSCMDRAKVRSAGQRRKSEFLSLLYPQSIRSGRYWECCSG